MQPQAAKPTHPLNLIQQGMVQAQELLDSQDKTIRDLQQQNTKLREAAESKEQDYEYALREVECEFEDYQAASAARNAALRDENEALSARVQQL